MKFIKLTNVFVCPIDSLKSELTVDHVILIMCRVACPIKVKKKTEYLTNFYFFNAFLYCII